jgi:arylsulfatase A-like enzyme
MYYFPHIENKSRRSFLMKSLSAAVGLSVAPDVWGKGYESVATSNIGSLRGALPNILVILVDDLGYGDLKNYGCPEGETPYFDKFFREGLKFTSFYSNGAFCAPTRASLLTGLYPQHAGIWRAPSSPVKSKTKKRDRDQETIEIESLNERGFPDDIELLPRLLKNEGYKTAMFGKWHLGYESPNIPNDRGFDHFMGFLQGSSPYGPNHKTLRLNREPYEEKGHLTEIFTQHAIDYIEKHNMDERFFMYLSYNAPHGPIENGVSMHSDIVKKYKERGIGEKRANYLALIDHLDQNIERVMTALETKGIDENTIVFLLSDNGGQLNYLGRNLPLRGGKGQVFEGGIRVPCAVRWPGMINGGTVTDTRTATMDLFPTILEIAGASVPEQNADQQVSGISLVDHLTLEGRSTLPDRYLFFEHLGMVGAIHGTWKIVADIYGKRETDPKVTNVTMPKVFELYNLDQDIGETINLAKRHPEIVRGMENELVKWMRSYKRTQFTNEWKL